MRLLDITGWIHHGMWQYFPEYLGAEIAELPQPQAMAGRAPVFLQQFTLSGQSGTYIENRAHFDGGAPPVVDLPLETFWRPAVVVSVGLKAAREPVTVEDLERASVEIRPGDAVLLHTGWDAKWRHPAFVDESPYISPGAARWLFAREMGLLGGDLPRFDLPTQPCFPWDEFWGAVGLLLAPVIDLAPAIGRRTTLIAMPLRIVGACSTPCRAVLLDGVWESGGHA